MATDNEGFRKTHVLKLTWRLRRTTLGSRVTATGAPDLISVDVSALREVNSRDPIGEYLKALCRRRFYIALDARSKALKSDHDLWLGRAWLLLQPMLDGLLYALLFGLILQTSRGIENFVGFLFLGITFFSIISKSLTTGTTLIKANKGMISAFHFPRAAIVLGQALKNLYDSVPPVVVAVVAALLLQIDTAISWSVTLVLPIFLLVHLFSLGVMFFVARLCAQIPDLRIPINLGQRAWLMLSGVFFSVERFVEHPFLLKVMTANPAYQYLTATRDVVLYSTIPPLSTWLNLCAWALVTFILGFLFFWQAEEKYINVG